MKMQSGADPSVWRPSALELEREGFGLNPLVRSRSERLRADRIRTLCESHPISVFAVCAFAWSWLIWLPLAASGLSYELRLWKYLYVVGLCGPLVASIGVTLLIGGTRGVLGLLRAACFWHFSPVWYMAALFTAPVLMLVSIAIGRLGWHTSLTIPNTSAQAVVLTFGWMIVRGGPANEELGWRGFVLPRLLKRHSPFWASMVLLPIWAVWHWPLWLLPGLPHKYWPFLYFLLVLAPLTLLFTWLHCRARGSVVPAVLFHGSINTAIQFLPMLPPRHPSLDLFGIWIVLTWGFAAVVVWCDRRLWFSLPAPRTNSPGQLTPPQAGG